MLKQKDEFTIEQVRLDKENDYVLDHYDGDLPIYRKVMNDEEIYEAAMSEWLGVLAKLWTAFGKTPVHEQMVVYQEMLADVPLGLLEKSVNRAIREHKFSNIPTSGEVWDAFMKELKPAHGMSVRDAVELWKDKECDCVLYRFDVVAVETEA